jgi:hypothetical protein
MSTDVPKEVRAQHRRQYLQGLLFLIDHPGEQLPEETAPKAEWRSFTDRVIASHLTKHTYYCQKGMKPNLENKQVVDVDWMRRQIENMYDRGATPSTKALSVHSHVDSLFYSGSEGVEANLLASYGYNKSTFLEADLPAHRKNEDEDDVADDSENSSDAEGSEYEHESPDGSASDHHHTKGNTTTLEDITVLKKDTHGRTDRLAKRVEVQSAVTSIKRAVPAASSGDARQSPKVVLDLQDQPKPRFRLLHNSVQPQDVDAGRRILRSVSADHERIHDNSDASGSSAELKKRKREARDDKTHTEQSPKVSRLSHGASRTTQPENALPITEEHHATTTAPTGKRPSEDAAATSESHVRPPIELDTTPIRLDTSVLTKELGKLKHDTLQTIEAVLNCISRNLFQYPTALDPEPPQRLLNLYVRCWGKDWEVVRLRLTREYLFTAPQVTMSLVSAFLYGNVLNQEASLLDEIARLRSIASLEGSGELVCHFLRSEHCWSGLKASAHAVYTTEAHALLAQDEAVVQDQLHKEAEKLATDLQSIVAPHFRALSQFARAYGESSGQPEEAWMEIFKSGMTDIIQRCLHHRLRLRGTGFEYVHTWPNAGEEFDSQSMQPDRKHDDPNVRQPVLFTVFPGLEVTSPDERDEKMYIRAVVKVKQNR